MKNLKKLLAVIIAVTVLATSIIPAFAAGSYNYSAQAQALYDLGLYKGSNPNTFEPDLGSPLDRQQGVVMLVRLLGKEAAALALSNSEVDSTLIIFSDANKIASWAKKYVAYAVLYKYVAGLPNGTFAPNDPLLGKQFGTMLLNALGYTVDAASYAAACYQLSNIGAITFAEAAKFNDKELIRDDMVGIAYGILAVNYKATGKSVIETMVEQKIVTEAAAIAAGVYNHKLEKDARAAIEEYKKGSLNTLEEIAAVEKKKADADAKVAKIVDEATKKALQKEIDVRTNEIAEAKAAINAATEAENKAIADAEAAVKAYESASLATTADVAKAESLKQEAIDKANLVKTESSRKGFLSRIDAQAKKIEERKVDLANIAEATAAVDAYLVAAYDSLEKIAEAEKLGAVAEEKIAKIVDTTAKNDLKTKVDNRKKLIADAKTKLSSATVSVTADNFKTMKLVFSKEMDATSLSSSIKLDNGARPFTLESAGDKKTFFIIYSPEITNQSTSVKLTIDGAKDLNGVEFNKFEQTYIVKDITDPQIKSIEVVSAKTIRIYTSEPISIPNSVTSVVFDGNSGVNFTTITVDNVYVYADVTQNLVKGYIQLDFVNTLPAGSRTMVINGLKDYAGFVASGTYTFQVAEDKTPPVATAVEMAGKDKVKVTFNENIADANGNPYYYYYTPEFYISLAGSDSKVSSKGRVGGDEYKDNTVILKFDDGTINLLATIGFTIEYRYVADALGNYVAETAKISGVAKNDTTKPVVASVTVESDNTIKVVFSKEVDPKEGNFKLLNTDKTVYDSSAKSVQDYDANNPDGKTFKVTFGKLESGTDAKNYILEIDGVTDLSINQNKVDAVQQTISVFDTKTPTIDAIIVTTATSSKPYTLEIYFSEAMNASYVTNKANYYFNYVKDGNPVAVPLSTIQNATLTTSDNKKIVITLPENGTVNNYPITGLSILATDQKGNALTGSGAIGSPYLASNFVNPANSDTLGNDYVFNHTDISSLKFVAFNKIELKLKSDSKNSFSTTTPIPVDAFQIVNSSGAVVDLRIIGAVVSSNGKTLTITLGNDVSPDAQNKNDWNSSKDVYEYYRLVTNSSVQVKDQYGIVFNLALKDDKGKDIEAVKIKDGIAPMQTGVKNNIVATTTTSKPYEYDSVTGLLANGLNVNDSYVELTFNEAVKSKGAVTDMAVGIEVKIGSKTLVPGLDYYTVFKSSDNQDSITASKGTSVYIKFTSSGSSKAKDTLKKDLSNLTVKITNADYIVDVEGGNKVVPR